MIHQNVIGIRDFLYFYILKPFLAKSSCGWSPLLVQNEKIEGKKNTG